MPRQKSNIPLRPFNLSLPLPLYDEMVKEQERRAAHGRKVSVTDLLLGYIYLGWETERREMKF